MKGIAKIKGPFGPKVGHDETYEVTEYHKGETHAIAHPELIQWKLYYDHDGLGIWKEVAIPKKIGRKATFNFPQKWYGKRLMIEAFVYEPEMRAPPGLPIHPKMGTPKIDKLEVCNFQGKALTETPSYGQSIVLKVHTHNMMGKTIKLSFWEKDTMVRPTFDPFYHDPKGNTLLWSGTTKVKNRNGIAEEKIMLNLNMAMLANKTLYDKSKHQYYILAEAENTNLDKTLNTNPKAPDAPVKPGAPAKPATPAKPKTPATPKKDEGTSILGEIGIVIKNIIGWDPFETDTTNKKVVVEVPDEKKKEDKNTCPRCKEPVTLAQLKKIFTQADDATLTTAAATYTKYMKELGMDTCWNKAHFFAQAVVESGLKLKVKEGENFNWYFQSLISTFGAFKTDEGKKKAKLWGRENLKPKHPGVTPENEKNIANWAYSPSSNMGKILGNTKSNDGWDFRGKGLIQLTGRSAYEYANTYTKKEGADIITNSDMVATDVSIAVLSSMAFWKWKKIYNKCNGISNNKSISTLVGNDVRGSYDEKQKVFTKTTSVVFKIDDCVWGKKTGKIKDFFQTYDSKYKADKKTSYIDIIVPSNRKKEGLLVFIDETGILFKCYVLGLGTGGEDRYTNGGFGNVPNGLWDSDLELKTANTGVSFGNHGVIRLSPSSGDSLKAKSRKGILMHCGHTMGDGKTGLTDNGALMVTHGCLRVYNADMPKITNYYSEALAKSKSVKIYVEEIEPEDLNEVFTFYNTVPDTKDSTTNRKNKKNDSQ